MFPSANGKNQQESCFLHVRGGVSKKRHRQKKQHEFSPRAWRCFSRLPAEKKTRAVFSTCVEVFPSPQGMRDVLCRFLHVRGGVSERCYSHSTFTSFSPRAWRCFLYFWRYIFWSCVFSTCVEVFPKRMIKTSLKNCFLHVRGGVSTLEAERADYQRFSPRAWRCFSPQTSSVLIRSVFSTCVEVFLDITATGNGGNGFLHVRGGVSFYRGECGKCTPFSPRAWRCFSLYAAF